MSGCVFVVPAMYIGWRNRVPAKVGRGESKTQHLHDSVVMWLMILQRLQPGGTLANGVEALLGGAADSLLSRRRRARQKRISRSTGGYSHARQRLPKLLCRPVAGELVLRLREMLNPAGGRMSYVLDGSSLELEASP
jgi:hypothetical protein